MDFEVQSCVRIKKMKVNRRSENRGTYYLDESMYCYYHDRKSYFVEFLTYRRGGEDAISCDVWLCVRQFALNLITMQRQKGVSLQHSMF